MATPSKAITFTTHSRQLSLSTHWLNHLVNSEELAHFPTERGIVYGQTVGAVVAALP